MCPTGVKLIVQNFCVSPSPSFLYIHGPSGHGKTRILQDIQQYKEGQKEKVLCIEAHMLCEYLMEAIQKEAYDTFEQLLLENDVLLVDQLEDISGKWITFDVFCKLFKSLLQQGTSVAASLCIRKSNRADAKAHLLMKSLSICGNKSTIRL